MVSSDGSFSSLTDMSVHRPTAQRSDFARRSSPSGVTSTQATSYSIVASLCMREQCELAHIHKLQMILLLTKFRLDLQIRTLTGIIQKVEHPGIFHRWLKFLHHECCSIMTPTHPHPPPVEHVQSTVQTTGNLTYECE